MAQWLTLEEAAAYLRMGKSTIYTLVRTGHPPAHRAGKVWGFDAAELDDWLKSGGLQPDAIKKPRGPFRRPRLSAGETFRRPGGRLKCGR